MMQFDKKHLVGLAALSLSLLAFGLYSRKRKPEKVCNSSQKNRMQSLQSIGSEQLDHLATLEQILVHKSSQFDSILTSSCILQFLKSTYDLFDKQQIQSIYQKSREGRRKVFSKLQVQYEIYFRFICTFQQQIKYLIEKAQKDFAVFLGIDYSVITNSIEYHMANPKFRQQLANWTAQIRDIIRNQLPTYGNPLEQSRLLQVLQYETSLLNINLSQLKLLVSKIGIHLEEQIECLPTFLSCYLQDSIFFKFNVQNEQLNSQESTISLQLYQANRQFSQAQKTVINQLYAAVKDDIILQ